MVVKATQLWQACDSYEFQQVNEGRKKPWAHLSDRCQSFCVVHSEEMAKVSFSTYFNNVIFLVVVTVLMIVSYLFGLSQLVVLLKATSGAKLAKTN